MIKRRIRVFKKTITCLECNKVETVYWAIKDKLFQCICCKEVYFITAMDLTNQKLGNVIDNKNCVNCGNSLEQTLYECNKEIYCTHNRDKVINVEKNILLEFYDLR